MISLFLNNLLPVFLAAGAGYLLAHRTGLDPRPISQLAFFVLAPCLVFQIIVGGELTGPAFLRMAAFALVSLLTLAAIAAAIGHFAGWPRPLTAAVVLLALLPNAGNYGLSTNRFAWSEAGLAQASVFFLTSAVLTFTLGVMIASLGRSTLRTTLLGLLRVPAIWSVALAFLVVGSDVGLPLPVARTIELLSQASIPVFLVVLGMQLHGRGIRGPWAPLAVATGLRLIGGIVVGLVLARTLGLEGVAYQAGVLQSAMPAAVITIVLATEYDVEPAFVTSVVVTSTVASPLTLTPLLAFLGG